MAMTESDIKREAHRRWLMDAEFHARAYAAAELACPDPRTPETLEAARAAAGIAIVLAELPLSVIVVHG